MSPPDPDYAQHIHAMFEAATFVRGLGIRCTGCGPGWCEAEVILGPQHGQQDGFAHAGVEATLADHTAGGAAASLLDRTQKVLTIEFKINLLRPATGERLRCRATVLRQGRTLSVVESEVFAAQAGEEKLTAKATVTLALVPR